MYPIFSVYPELFWRRHSETRPNEILYTQDQVWYLTGERFKNFIFHIHEIDQRFHWETLCKQSLKRVLKQNINKRNGNGR